MFNALETSVKDMDVYEDWITHLRHVETFLSDKKLRRKFQSTLPPEFQPLFKSYATVHIDWRWEMLSKALDVLIPLLPVMISHWNEDLLLSSDSGKRLKSEDTKNCGKALKRPYFAELSELVRLHGKILDEGAHALEGCRCHKVHTGSNRRGLGTGLEGNGSFWVRAQTSLAVRPGFSPNRNITCALPISPRPSSGLFARMKGYLAI